jgi:hypothetical protein
MDFAFLFVPVLIVAVAYLSSPRSSVEITDEPCGTPLGC